MIQSSKVKSITEYFTEMTVIWDELESMVDLPLITEYTTEIKAFMNAYTKMVEEQRLLEFLNGLDEIYAP